MINFLPEEILDTPEVLDVPDFRLICPVGTPSIIGSSVGRFITVRLTLPLLCVFTVPLKLLEFQRCVIATIKFLLQTLLQLVFLNSTNSFLFCFVLESLQIIVVFSCLASLSS